jgi:hypothetical protein
VILFGVQSSGTFARNLYQAVSRLAITVVAHTNGVSAGQLMLAHPEQEAVLMHGYMADSLGVPGALCVTTTHYHMTAEGHAIPSPDPNTEAYHGGGNWVISPTGKTLSNNSFNIVKDEDLIWYLKRLRDKYSMGSPSPGQP